MQDHLVWIILGGLATLYVVSRIIRRKLARRAIRRQFLRNYDEVSKPVGSAVSLFEMAVVHFHRFDKDHDGRITMRDLFLVQSDRHERRPVRMQAGAILDHWEQLRDFIGLLTSNREQRLEVYRRFLADLAGTTTEFDLFRSRSRRSGEERWPRATGY